MKAHHPATKRPTEASRFEDVLTAFKRATGLDICIKVFDHGLRYSSDFAQILDRYSLHNSDFCLNVKRAHNEQCKECDLRQLPARCERERDIFTSTCHAGADEIILPLFNEEIIIGLAYVGQFRVHSNQSPTLPQISKAEIGHFMSLARLLAAYLGDKLGKPKLEGEHPNTYRATIIQSYLKAKLHSNPTLSDLAQHMGLSTTRVAHVVKEITGNSFIELKDEMRLNRARDLLRFTYHKIAYIAAQCGFSNPQYFHRFFKRKTGLTPQHFRNKNLTDV